jgi:hypothetical protein
MANTPIYGFETPDDTDLVKDGALSIRTALGDVDTTLGTALNSKDYSGLVLVKKQTIGSAVSSVTVTDAFSANYDNYLIVISGGVGSSSSYNSLLLGASTASYFGGIVGTNAISGAVANAAINNQARWIYAGWVDTSVLSFNCTLINPFLSKFTLVNGQFFTDNTGFNLAGRHQVATSYTSFTIAPINAGVTMTGGTIYVYGYGAS